jgi:NAD(P) transhydrogenase
MSSSVNCLTGYRLALRPRGNRRCLKLNASAFALRSTPVFHQEFHSKQSKSLQTAAGTHGLTCQRPLPFQQFDAKSQKTPVASFASVAEAHSEEIPTTPPFGAGPYSTLSIGVPKESYPGERRVAMTPQNVKLLLKKGFSRILIERGAGAEAEFTDEAYIQAGAKIVDRRSVFSESDILLKVRALSIDGADSEVDSIREHSTIISFLYPVQNRPVVDRIASRNATSFAMDMVPRISRAQVFDALR